MIEFWNLAGEASALATPREAVTVVEGSTFCISQRSGDILSYPESTEGLFFRDVRLLSHLQLLVNGCPLDPLEVHAAKPYSGVKFVCRLRAGDASSPTHYPLVVYRDRYIGRGMREDVRLVNSSRTPIECRLNLTLDGDFGHLFEVKQGRDVKGARTVRVDDNSLVLSSASGNAGARVLVHIGRRLQPTEHGFTCEVTVPARGEASICLQVNPILEGEEYECRYVCGADIKDTEPYRRAEEWQLARPIVEPQDSPLGRIVENGIEELGYLRMVDEEDPDATFVAAGAPWFMALFGRDSLLTGWMSLLVDPGLSLGVLETLARFQGTEVNRVTEEQPGRILHELRFGTGSSGDGHLGTAGRLSLRSGTAYYGSIDATPLFVMLLGEFHRWGQSPDTVKSLLENAERALEWMTGVHGDPDQDGYVEYEPLSEHGLPNQGWKDSPDAISFADGGLAEAPIALAEVQGYVYAAFRARYHFAYEAEDYDLADKWEAKADDLRRRFNEDFWLDDRQAFALALDRDKKPVDALASNMGHCLWTGIVDEEKAPFVARHLLSPDFFTGWGVRTLARSEARYDPISYHNGSVWPHDNAIIAAGLMRYKFEEEACRIINAMVQAASHRGGRLPELFTGIERSEFPTVVPYPTSCSPQAWAAASPLLFLRTLLGLEPSVPRKKMWVHPVLPEGVDSLHVTNIPLNGDVRMSVRAWRKDGEVEREVHWEPRDREPDIELQDGRRPLHLPEERRPNS